MVVCVLYEGLQKGEKLADVKSDNATVSSWTSAPESISEETVVNMVSIFLKTTRHTDYIVQLRTTTIQHQYLTRLQKNQMEECFAKLEVDLREQLERAQQELRDTVVKSQQEMFNQISRIMGIKAVEDQKEKEIDENPRSRIEGLHRPPIFVINTSITQQGASNQGGATTSHHAETSTQTFPNLNEVKEEFSKQLEETRKDFEEILQTRGETEGSFGLNAKDLILVPNLEIPPKFKMPEFEKFDGNTCPMAHITMFCRKMTGFIDNEGLLIHCFQDSLAGPAMRWYNQLTRDQVKSWKDLARSFTDQYKHVSDMVPNILMLQGLEQKPNESLLQYAQRWRDVAAQVQPPIQENEITPMFIDTLKGVLYDLLIGQSTVSFADIITPARVEAQRREGYKLDLPESARIHSVFHISQLKPCKGQPTQQVTPIPLLLDTNTSSRVPHAVIKKRTKRIDGQEVEQVLIKWLEDGETCFSWENAQDIAQEWPDLNLEDKVLEIGEGDVVSEDHGPQQQVSTADNQPQGCQSVRRSTRERRAPTALADFVIS
ncbi:hypothetical protein GQ457_15G011340 [Hibiscus cannabinus]